MSKRPRVMFGAAVAIVVVAMPAMAEGATFYAAQTGSGSECSSASPCSLEGAVTKADADMTRDTVRVIGALTHTSPVVLSTPVDLVGSGRGDGGTFIDVSGLDLYALRIQAASTASNLRVRKTDAWRGVEMTAGTTLTDATVQGMDGGVDVNQDAAGEARIERTSATATQPTAATVLNGYVTNAAATLRVLDSTFSGERGMFLAGAGRTIVQRSAVDAELYGIWLDTSSTNPASSRLSLSSSLIRMRPGSSFPPKAIMVRSTMAGETASADIRHATIDGSAVGNDRGIEASGVGGTNATVRGSIVRGFDSDLFTEGAGVALTAGTSDFSTRSSATGTINTTSLGGNVDIDPGYVDAAAFDYRLKSTSPLIDKAGGDPIATDESPTDLAGAPRIVDGDGDGVALRDIGAFELHNGSPAPPPTAKRPSATHVICNRGPNPGDDSVCTATVGDADPASPNAARPSGIVRFTVNSLGTFRGSSDCMLQPTSTSPTVSSCAVTYIPGDTNFPDVTAAYDGDSTFLASNERTSLTIGAIFGLPDGTSLTTATCMTIADRVGAGTASAAARGPRAVAAYQRANANKNPAVTGRYGSGEAAGYCATNLLYQAVGFTERTVQLAVVGVGTAAAVVGGAAALTVPGAQVEGGVIAGGSAVTAVLAWNVGEAVIHANDRALADPPDPAFTNVVKPARSERVTVRPGRGLSRADARRLASLIATQKRARALAKALAATLDKVGGARNAKNRRYEGIQMRAAVGYARQLADTLETLISATKRGATILARIKAFTRAPSAGTVSRFRKLVAAGRLPKRFRAILAAAGLDKRDVAQLQKTAKVKPAAVTPRIPKTLAGLVGDAEQRRLYEITAAGMRLFVNLDEVIASSKLK